MSNINIPSDTPQVNHQTIDNLHNFILYNAEGDGSLNLITLRELILKLNGDNQTTLSSIESEIFQKTGSLVYNFEGNVQLSPNNACLFFENGWRYKFHSSTLNRAFSVLLPVGRKVCFSQGGNIKDKYYILSFNGSKTEDVFPNTVEFSQKLNEPRSIDGIFFNGSSDISHAAYSRTNSETQRKNVIVSYDINIANGCKLDIYFENSNTAIAPVIAINDSRTAYPIYYKDEPVPIDLIKERCTYTVEFKNYTWNIISSTPVRVDNTLTSTSRTDAASADSVRQLNELIATRERGTTFETIQSMVDELNSAQQITYGAVRNLFIVDNVVPNFWISGFEDTEQFYQYTSDDDLINEINAVGSVQIGFYKISKSKTNVEIDSLVEKNTKIAGFLLENDISVEQLKTALGVVDVIYHHIAEESETIVNNTFRLEFRETPTRKDLKLVTTENLIIDLVVEELEQAGYVSHNLCISNETGASVDVNFAPDLNIFSTNSSFTIANGAKVDLSYQKGTIKNILGEDEHFCDFKISLPSYKI